ncbi:MAG: hypothetical protein KDA85_07600 [Planctomycetaceae bacterium]|nr:hypothetical protein [Planctomycetaceae bacterium]
MVPRFRQQLPRMIAATLLLVVVGALSAERAFCSCGDYLHTRSSTGLRAVALPTTESSRSAVAQLQDGLLSVQGQVGVKVATRPIPHHCPCQGPQCRRSELPNGPASPGVPVVRSSVPDALAGQSLQNELQHVSRQAGQTSRVFASRGFPLALLIPPEAIA